MIDPSPSAIRLGAALAATAALVASVPAPAEAQSCFPPCRHGFVCHQGICITECNPPCAAGQECTATGCQAVSRPAPPPPTPPPPTPAAGAVQVPTCDGTDVEAAQAASRRGRNLYREAVSSAGGPDLDRMRAALEEFERQCAAGDDWALEYRASALLVLGRHLDAARSMDAFLYSHPIVTLPADVRARVEANMPLFGERVGTIRVTTNAPNAQARVDGGPAVPLDGRVLRVAPGTAEISVWAPGAAGAARRRVSVAAGETIEIDVPLERASSAPAQPPPPTTTPTDSVALTSPSAGAPPTRPASADDEGGSLGGIAVATGVVGGLFLVGGVVAAIVHEERVATYNDEGCPDAPGMTGCSGVLDEIDLTSTLLTVGFIGAGVLAVTTVVLLVVDGSSGDDGAESSKLACSPAVGEAIGGVCRARF